MGDKTKIEWTSTRHADGTATPGATWNPIRGIAPDRWMCRKISPGCDNCYASTMNHRWGGKEYAAVGEAGPPNVVLNEKVLGLPLTWKEPRRVFVCSMTDLFGEWVPDGWVDQLFGVMALTPWHTYQVLTKRPARMRKYLTELVKGPWAGRMFTDGLPDTDVHRRVRDAMVETFSLCSANVLNRASDWQEEHYPAGDGFMRQWPLPNVWIGTSIELDRFAWRAEYVRQCPAAVRFISAEPLLGPLPSLSLHGIDWLITGGESGRPHRPIEADWVRDLRDRCQAEGVAFFHKQWGGATHSAGGRDLDGRTWDEFPDPVGLEHARKNRLTAERLAASRA